MRAKSRRFISGLSPFGHRLYLALKYRTAIGSNFAGTRISCRVGTRVTAAVRAVLVRTADVPRGERRDRASERAR